MAEQSAAPSGAASGIIAYLTGEYPKVSHTFIQREVAALRALGCEVLTFSVRDTAAAEIAGAEERAARATTFYILRHARNPLRLAAAHAALAVAAPGRYLGALGLALATRTPGARALVYQIFYFAEAGVLARELVRRRVRHLHNHFADSSCTVAMLASALSGIPFSFTVHGPTEFFEVGRWAIGEKVARARFVVCISHFCRSQVMLFSAPADWPKLRIVRCGVDPARYGAPAGPAGGADEAGARLLFVGRLSAAKGVPILLEAFARLLVDHPSATLTLVGDGPDRHALERRAEALGLGGAISFTGYQSQDEVARLLGRADIFVLPSFAEGLPIVLMEAMASGIPVVTTRIAGIPELVEDGVHGRLVCPGDVDGLVAAIAPLLGNRDLCRAMGAAGRAKVMAEHDVARQAERLGQMFDDSLSGPTTG